MLGIYGDLIFKPSKSKKKDPSQKIDAIFPIINSIFKDLSKIFVPNEIKIWKNYPLKEFGEPEIIKIDDFKNYPKNELIDKFIEVWGFISFSNIDEESTKRSSILGIDLFEMVPEYPSIFYSVIWDSIDQKSNEHISNWKKAFESTIRTLKPYGLSRLCISDYPQSFSYIENSSAIWMIDKKELFKEIYRRLKFILKRKGIPPWLGILPSDAKNILSRTNFIKNDYQLFEVSYFNFNGSREKTIFDDLLKKSASISMVEIAAKSIQLIDPKLSVTSIRLILRYILQSIKHSSSLLPDPKDLNSQIHDSIDEWIIELKQADFNLEIFEDP